MDKLEDLEHVDSLVEMYGAAVRNLLCLSTRLGPSSETEEEYLSRLKYAEDTVDIRRRSIVDFVAGLGKGD